MYPGHDPKPNGLKVGIVGTTHQGATARRQLSATLPGAQLVTERSSAGARAAIKDRELYGSTPVAPPTSRRCWPSLSRHLAIGSYIQRVGCDARAAIANARPSPPRPSLDPDAQGIEQTGLFVIGDRACAVLGGQARGRAGGY